MTDPYAALAALKRERTNLRRGTIILRPLDEADVLPAYPDGLNHPDVARFVEAAQRQRQTMETVTAFVRANREDPAAVLFGIFVDGVLRGTLRLHDVTAQHGGEAWVGIALFDRSVWGRDVGSTALALVAACARDDLRLVRLRAGIEPTNAGSRRAFAKAGFVPTESLVRPKGKRVERWVLALAGAIKSTLDKD